MTRPARAMSSAAHPVADDDGSAAITEFIAHGGSEASRSSRRCTATAFACQFTDLTGWMDATFTERLTAPLHVRGLVARLLVATGSRAGADYVVDSGSNWGSHAAVAHPEFFDHFNGTAQRIGFNPTQIKRQWNTLAKICATTGATPNSLNANDFGKAAVELTEICRRFHGRITNSWSTPLHGLKATLAALGTLDSAPPTRISPSQRGIHWNELAERGPKLTATLSRYLTQITVSMRPGSVALIDTTLRHFAVYLTEYHPDITVIADVRRTHIEGFKTFLTNKSGYRGNPAPAKTTTGMRLGHLRGFFDRIIEWDYTDAPARNPIFAGDMPIRDRPLPRFLDDADAAALLTSARGLSSLFDRVTVEVLALTGMRKGEFLGLTRDAVTVVGDARWLRTPIGKLHTDRYIPLHPRVEELLLQWLSDNPPQPRTSLMFTDRGRPIPGRRVDYAVHAAANHAGIGHVTPHQLRHTLATQAINRGMSLEAIAALLGHASLSMTMTYARIADRTVAEEYFAVTKHVDRLYNPTASTTTTVPEGPNMQRLRQESTRLLGNGTCTRPALLDCRYETICETCTHFSSNNSHRQTLTNQAANAAQRGETRREKVYLELITKLDRANT